MRLAVRRASVLIFCFCFALPLLAIVPSATGPIKGDAYLGYSRLGANTFYSNVGSLYGLEGAVHFKLKPFVGVEADVSQYGYGKAASVPRTTAFLLGPRVTVKALGFRVFGHALGGLAHTANSGAANVSMNKLAYGMGVGAEFPIAPFFAWRVTGDYLSTTGSKPLDRIPARIGTGLVFKF